MEGGRISATLEGGGQSETRIKWPRFRIRGGHYGGGTNGPHQPPPQIETPFHRYFPPYPLPPVELENNVGTLLETGRASPASLRNAFLTLDGPARQFGLLNFIRKFRICIFFFYFGSPSDFIKLKKDRDRTLGWTDGPGAYRTTRPKTGYREVHH